MRISRVCCDITLVIGHLRWWESLKWVRSGSVGSSAFVGVLHSGFGFSVRRKMEVTDKREHTSHDVLSHNICPYARHQLFSLQCLPLCSWIWLLFKVHMLQEHHFVFNSIMGQKQMTLFSSVLDNLGFPPSCTSSCFQTTFCENIIAPSCCCEPKYCGFDSWLYLGNMQCYLHSKASCSASNKPVPHFLASPFFKSAFSHFLLLFA